MGTKNKPFGNNSCEPKPIGNKFGTHAQVKGRQPSADFKHDQPSGGKMASLDESGAAGDFHQILPRYVNLRPTLKQYLQ